MSIVVVHATDDILDKLEVGDLRVLVLTPEFVPISGGVGAYVLEICRRMTAEVELHIITPMPSRGLQDTDREIINDLPPHVRVRYIGSTNDAFFGTFPFQMNCGINLRDLARQLDIDLIHSQSSMPDFFLPPGKTGIPTVTTIHTTLEGHIKALRNSQETFAMLSRPEKFSMILEPVLNQLENYYYSSSRRYITVSEWGLREFSQEKSIPAHLIRVVHNGVDTSVFSPRRDVEQWNELDNATDSAVPIILYLSRLVTRKGIGVLAKAIPKVLKEVDCHFVIGGSGRLPEMSVDSNCLTNLGYVPSDKIPLLYAKSDIFILPSFYENFPISVLEAMASECAVIATDVCGIPEMIEDETDGLLTKPGDVEGTAQAIIRLVEDSGKRRSLGNQARRKVCSKFSWDDTVDKTVRYYREIVHGSS